ncbi:MAG TPA: hypothetical protein VG844_09900 [Terracidiphilus sp.]|nr:hypothetical protein [Terracidiphilus sp.]
MRAAKLRRKDMTGQWKIVKRIAFWLMVIVVLLALWSAVKGTGNQSDDKSAQTTSNYDSSNPNGDETSAPQTSIGKALSTNLLPFLVIAGVWVWIFFWRIPQRTRDLYRKNPAIHGEITVNITPESFISSAAGSKSEIKWEMFDHWLDGGDFLLLVYKSTTSSIVNISGLTPSQCAQLRSILANALPQR